MLFADFLSASLSFQEYPLFPVWSAEMSEKKKILILAHTTLTIMYNITLLLNY